MGRKKKITFGAAGLLLVILILVAWQALTKLNQPSNGVTTTTPIPAVSHASAVNLTPVQASSPYVSFKYPAALQAIPSTSFGAPIIAELNYTYRDVESWHLAVIIESVPAGQLTSNSGYQFRKQNPQTYHETTETINGASVDIMTDTSNGGFSKVAYLVNGSYQASVSLIGDDSVGAAPLQQTFNMVLSSWRWQ